MLLLFVVIGFCPLKDEAISNIFWSSSGGILVIMSVAVLSMSGVTFGIGEEPLFDNGFCPWSEVAMWSIFCNSSAGILVIRDEAVFIMSGDMFSNPFPPGRDARVDGSADDMKFWKDLMDWWILYRKIVKMKVRLFRELELLLHL